MQSGLPFPSPRDLPDPGIKPRSLESQTDFVLPSEPPGKTSVKYIYILNKEEEVRFRERLEEADGVGQTEAYLGEECAGREDS